MMFILRLLVAHPAFSAPRVVEIPEYFRGIKFVTKT
jgi:hypothetical protein